jgi:hypothetical protein
MIDFIMYIVFAIVVDMLTPSDLRLRANRELGALGGLIILLVYSVIYLILFAVFFDWIDLWNAMDFTVTEKTINF